MAEHELYIADVFWHMGKYGPAWRRYEYVVDSFSDVPDVAKHAKEKRLAAFHHYRAETAADTRSKRQGSWREWFRWL